MTTPFVFGVLFLSAILGGLFAMRSPYKVGWILTVLLIALLLVWPLMVFYLKPLLLPQSVFLIRSLVLGCVVGLTAFLTEIPYIMGLRELKGKDRTQLFVFGKIGSAVGIYMGLCATLYFGFSGGFYLASVSYLAVFFCICVIRFGEVSFLSGRGENY
ncbi:MAG: hypothetical protein KDD35_10660 [Bdellovibrionales bacterium]|nr:hypothetical protein [Bdellovibrionales bacterium]